METTIQNETIANLFKELDLSAEHVSNHLELLAGVDSKYLKELRINISNAYNSSTIDKKDSFLLGLAVAVNEKHTGLQEALTRQAIAAGATEQEIAETIACTSLMNINNVFYRFRHFVKKEYYTQTPAGIKMGIMANPILGKELFELISLVVSALNGCELCVSMHEESLLKHQSTQARILDAVKIGAITKGLTAVL
jgi:alkyl hydroperoxide reductase subunit D